MKPIVENKFRDPNLVQSLVKDLQKWDKPVKLMEVCGTHTMAIGRWGIRKLLPKSIKLLSGPGCPVCVTPSTIIDALVELDNIAIATFGDLIRVPGKNGSLEQARARGLDVRIVYSPADALKIAQKKEVVFVGIGFETTSPGIGYTLRQAVQDRMKNFSLLPAFKVIPPALETLAQDKDISIDGLILPGHVSTIIGSKPYEFLPEKYNVGGVITGFEPVDILIGIKMLLEQIDNKKPEIEIEYKRIVKEEGNPEALSVLEQVFQLEDSLWRGLGWIKNSGLTLKKKYNNYNAIIKYGIKIGKEESARGCRCGDVLKGKIIPPECPLFKKVCSPSNPIGACMVSSEGSCAAFYRYGE